MGKLGAFPYKDSSDDPSSSSNDGCVDRDSQCECERNEEEKDDIDESSDVVSDSSHKESKSSETDSESSDRNDSGDSESSEMSKLGTKDDSCHCHGDNKVNGGASSEMDSLSSCQSFQMGVGRKRGRARKTKRILEDSDSE